MMKKILLLIIFLFNLFHYSSYASANGFINIYDDDIWQLFNEKNQYSVINYQNGIEKMLLTVNTSQQLEGEKAVWIFPIPAKAEQSSIDICQGFPDFFGYDIEESAIGKLRDGFRTMIITQIYTLPYDWFASQYIGQELGMGSDETAVTVHESIEKMGLITELISTSDSNALQKYILSKDLNLNKNSMGILNEYIGKDYSFVVSWINNVDAFKKAQKLYSYEDEPLAGNSISVLISFPTDKIFFPLKPTSIYGKKEVPAIIYVLDNVKPELYENIKSDTKINYYNDLATSANNDLKDLFSGFDLDQDIDSDIFYVNNLKYTKIKINTQSDNLTEDLWFNYSIDNKIKYDYFLDKYEDVFYIFIFVLCSCLASLLSGLIIFRDKSIYKYKFLLFGLWNFFTLIGFSIAANLSKIDTKFIKNSQDEFIQDNIQKTSFGKIALQSLKISLLITLSIALIIFIAGCTFFEMFFLIYLLITFIILFFLLIPIVWSYYRNKLLLKFIILFSVIFIILASIFHFIFLLIF